MRRLLLMRHAKTEKDSPTGKDRDRPLDTRGLADAETMGLYLAQHDLLPQLALVSTAVRAQQTWQHVSAVWPGRARIAVEHLDDLYGADPGDLIRIIRAASVEDPQRLLVIAHNPGLHELALTLVTGGDTAAWRVLLENLPTSGIVSIDFSIDDWSNVSFRRGALERFVSPRLLKDESDKDMMQD
jgi:phosphohistidine phosphatase